MLRRPVLSTSLRKTMLLVVAFGLTAAWFARGGVPPTWAYSAHRSITHAMTRQGIPGLSVAVVTNGRIRWSGGYGLADLENHVPARVGTVYRLASVSKPITAVAVLQLAERGQLDLDAPVQTYVPQFPQKPWPITCRQLLAHLGGIRHYQRDELLSVRSYARVHDALEIFRDDPLVAEPGTKHVYSTYGYNLLGAAIEGASGHPYIDCVGLQIFRPAHMGHTLAADHDAIIPNRAHGYVKDRLGRLQNSRPADLSNKIPGGGLCGTVEDLARFAIAVQSGMLVKPETARAMFTPQKTRDGKEIAYGLGWSLSRHNGRVEVWHAGNQQQVSNLLYMVPDRGVAVALMTNLEHAHLLDLAREIADAAAPAPAPAPTPAL